MKKALFTLMICLMAGFLMPSCEKELTDDYPIMEQFYAESITLPTVTIDSVSAFKNKVNGYVTTYPQAKEHRRYPQIIENIKAASLRLTIVIDTTWAGDTVIHY